MAQSGITQKKSSKSSWQKVNHGNGLSHQDEQQKADEAVEASDMATKISQVDQFLSTLDPQDLKVLKQRIQIKDMLDESTEKSNVWEKHLAKSKHELSTLHGEDSALRLKPEVSEYPVALFTWDDWLEKVRESLLSHWFNPDTIVAMLLDWATNAMMPTFDWWLIEDHKTRFSYINKAIKLLWREKKEPVTIRIQPITDPQHFI